MKAATITKSDIDRLLQEMRHEGREIAAIGESFKEINSSLRRLTFQIDQLDNRYHQIASN